jgi:hypothetical protein
MINAKNGLPVIELQESHVPVGYGEEGNGCAHRYTCSVFVLTNKARLWLRSSRHVKRHVEPGFPAHTWERALVFEGGVK